MKTIIDFFEESVKNYPNNTLIWEKEDKEFKSHSYKEIQKEVYTYANGLLSLGIDNGDRLALLSEGRRLWLVSELAIFHIGAINVPLSTKLEADADLVFRLNHSEAETIIVSKNQLPKIRTVKKQLTKAKRFIILDDIENLQDDEISIDVLYKKADTFKDKNPEALKNTIEKVTPETFGNICYTSGTTADPKGIILSQRNYTANVEQAFSYIEIPQHYKTLVVLPWDHAFAHTAALYSFMHKGASIASVQIGRNQHETLKNFVSNMMEVKPEILMSVPALAKNFKKNIEKGIESKGKMANSLFHSGLKFAYWYNGTGNNAGKGIRKVTKPVYGLFRAILFNKIKEKFGGQLQYFIGGGALLDIELQRFFYAIGMPMYQGYGLSEASPIISANTPKFHKLGSSGKVVNDLEIKICDEEGNELPIGEKGEIVIKGENVMKGYWKNPEATADTIKDDWLFTGDLGYLDRENYLYVLGRFKSLLIGADGEKYSPEGIEEAIIDHCQYIDQFVLHNNQNPYTTGLIVPNKEKIQTWLKQHKTSIDDDNALTEILNLIKEDIENVKNSNLPELSFPARWMPSTSVILPEAFTEHNKLLNSTMKVVRAKVEVYFQKEIEYLYTSDAKNFISEQNKINLKTIINS
ncbi:AMP-dependent synthetase/ligase [Carboxylicivirga linearis]|uniref:AMP-binding protein n=1 Tax=Carboxylicivirga linearis TaxID=1628157 RepID=A0ABS5JRB7_9BACT|nr:AMP-binding protein [Carboxylicivirga linearis]MBS2097332.1 AMP-binding protein [Carboxylicivirga linearis]